MVKAKTSDKNVSVCNSCEFVMKFNLFLCHQFLVRSEGPAVYSHLEVKRASSFSSCFFLKKKTNKKALECKPASFSKPKPAAEDCGVRPVLLKPAPSALPRRVTSAACRRASPPSLGHRQAAARRSCRGLLHPVTGRHTEPESPVPLRCRAAAPGAFPGPAALAPAGAAAPPRAPLATHRREGADGLPQAGEAPGRGHPRSRRAPLRPRPLGAPGSRAGDSAPAGIPPGGA